MVAGFGSFVEEVSLFHGCLFRKPALRLPAYESMADDEGLAEGGQAVRKAKKRVFSIVKAVKANARAQVGPVPAEKVLPDPRSKARRDPKHKKTLQQLIEGERRED